MTTEEKFHAAVNVIRSLPKNGSYQPSNELMLRFYSYFKQATRGPCCGSRPAFWDIVGRAKYDAWKKLGDMSKNQAMAKYVEELHTIVETMSYSDKVANFLEAPTNELDAINMDDLELVAGDVMERVRSQPNSPLASREASPIRFGSSLSPTPPSTASISQDSDHSDEEYIDTIENPEPRKLNHVSRSRTKSVNVDVSLEIAKTVQSLKGDIERLSSKITSIESANNKVATLKRKRGFFHDLPGQTVVFMLVWPFVATFIMNRFIYRKK